MHDYAIEEYIISCQTDYNGVYIMFTKQHCKVYSVCSGLHFLIFHHEHVNAVFFAKKCNIQYILTVIIWRVYEFGSTAEHIDLRQ